MIDSFLNTLFDHGRVRVGHPDQPLPKDSLHQSGLLLVQYEDIRRLAFPGEPPPFSLPAAQWAATTFYRACQAATFRDLPAELLPEFFREACPEGNLPSLHYSVDLVFQFLPDLSKLAGHVSPSDPLLEHLREWANQWPLSSVGMKDISPPSLRGIVEHPGLLQYYVDRVIARKDVTRMAHPDVRKATRRALSLYQGLFPEFNQ
jgi:hypothetical protein